jgi:hypothetical protein
MIGKNCKGLNLLNYLKQKGIDFKIEQNQYKSTNLYKYDLKKLKKNCSKDIQNNGENYTYWNVVQETPLLIDFNEVKTRRNKRQQLDVKKTNHSFKINLKFLENKEERLKEQFPLWTTKFTFNGNEYITSGKTKRISLEAAVFKAESEIFQMIRC